MGVAKPTSCHEQRSHFAPKRTTVWSICTSSHSTATGTPAEHRADQPKGGGLRPRGPPTTEVICSFHRRNRGSNGCGSGPWSFVHSCFHKGSRNFCVSPARGVGYMPWWAKYRPAISSHACHSLAFVGGVVRLSVQLAVACVRIVPGA